MGQRGEMVLPAGISPATWRFEAARSGTLSYGSISFGADGETCTLVGRFARQFTKLLLSLLSHAGMKWYVGTNSPRAPAWGAEPQRRLRLNKMFLSPMIPLEPTTTNE